MRSSTFFMITLAGLAASACSTTNRGLVSEHQPVVQRSDYVLDVETDSSSGLTRSDTARLSGWFESLQLKYGDKVSVDLGQYGSEAARASVAAIASQFGLLLENVAPVTPGEIAPDGVRVIVSRTRASVPGCPDWSRNSASDFASRNSSNYGCATNSNLAAMVANPEDLIKGRTQTGTTDASTSNKGIKTYREKPSTGAGELRGEGAGGR